MGVSVQVDRNKDLLRKFEEQSLQKREMHHAMTDLRGTLGDTKQGRVKKNDFSVYGLCYFISMSYD